MNSKRLLLMVLASVFVAGISACANTSSKEEATSIRLSEVVGHEEAAKYKPATWGGIIVGVTNLKDHSDIEVVAYPLDIYDAPRTNREPLGRFVATQKGYLESANYAAGKRITVDGSVLGSRAGMVGEADYTFPTLLAHKLKLWPDLHAKDRGSPDVHFRFGIGSGGRSGVGVGVGF